MMRVCVDGQCYFFCERSTMERESWTAWVWLLWNALDRNPLLYQQDSEPATPVCSEVSESSSDPDPD